MGVLRRDLPKIQTYMRRVDPVNMRRARRLGAHRLHYTAVSSFIRETGLPGGGDWRVVYNCAPVSQYRFCGNTDVRRAPLVFLGRLERCKGAHTAVSVARMTGRRLLVAGNISNLPEEREYFYREIEPQIDRHLVEFVGPVDNVEKNRLLGSAAALLLPIEWDEPFPVVLPEALLCGTPVIGFRRGGVPEGIEHGKTGFLCDTPAEMAKFVGRLDELDRASCRAEGERRFGDKAITDDYERLYREALG